MDKEALGKIGNLLANWQSQQFDGIVGKVDEQAMVIIQMLEKFGYRKLPTDKPPLLNEVIRNERAKNITGVPYLTVLGNINWIVQAQREVDIKFFNNPTSYKGDRRCLEEN